MSALIRLSSKLPADEETNGLDSLHEQLVDNPDQVVCAITWLVVPKVTRVTATKEDVPTIEVRRVEPIGTVEQTPAAIQRLAADLYEKRTGRNPLPFDALVGHEDLIDVRMVEDSDL